MPATDACAATTLMASPQRRRQLVLSTALAVAAVMSASQALYRASFQLAFTGAALPHMPAVRPTAAASFTASSLPRQAEGEEEELDPEELAEREAAAKRAEYKKYLMGIDLDGDKLDNLQEWYEEALVGPGGIPPEKGSAAFLRDLILRSFFCEFNDKGWPKDNMAARAYTGELGRPCTTDFETAYETLKRHAKEGPFVGRENGQGWTWLVARQDPLGIQLYLTREVPYGFRPLALIKNSDPDEFFDKADWNRVFIRLHKWNLWGGPAYRFPYPVGKKQTAVMR